MRWRWRICSSCSATCSTTCSAGCCHSCGENGLNDRDREARVHRLPCRDSSVLCVVGHPHVPQVAVQAAWAHPLGSMSPGPQSPAALGDLAWNFRPEVVVPLLVAAGLYAVGWWRLSRRTPAPIARTRAGLALGGLLAIALALVSPLNGHAERLFVAHMVQHMLLITVAAPALLLADPFPIV